ncbi:MAG: thymidine kinase [Bacilli bacterium]|nr:thymidine kinase [Bacilli bacterium]
MGGLFFKYGTMGAGKSAELIKKKEFLEEFNKKVLVLKSEQATRDGKFIKSRNGKHIPCEYLEPFLLGKNIKNIEEIVKNYDEILIDEIQFCTENTINTLVDIVDNFDINITCFGLMTDTRTHMFEGSKRLLEVADNIEEIKCRCGECGKYKALFSIKVSGDNINGNYQHCCRKCAKRLLVEHNIYI